MSGDVNPNVVLPAGVYQHWKGPLYLVLGLAHDANADALADYPEMMQRVYAHNRGETDVPNKPVPLGEREVVVYVGLQLDSAHEGARLAVRTLQDFFAPVCVSKEHIHYGKSEDIEPEVCRTVPRFSYRGPRFIDGMQMRRGFL